MEFLLGSIFLWPFIIGVWILLMCLSENDYPGSATVALLVVGGIACYLYDFNPFRYILNNPGTILGYLLGYVMIGIAWSFFKWSRLCSHLADKYHAAMEENKHITDKAHMDRIIYAVCGKLPPHPADHKSRIYGWQALWPLSASWFLLHEPITRLYRFIYARTVKTFETITEYYFGKFNIPK
jgi:hypothetical protein